MMKTLPIIFGHLGFNSADAFVLKDGRQLMVGTVYDNSSHLGQDPMASTGRFRFEPDDFFLSNYVHRAGYVTLEEVPNGEAVIAEYRKQLKEKGVYINPDIRYAG